MNFQQGELLHQHAVYGALFGFPLDWTDEDAVSFWLADVADWLDRGQPMDPIGQAQAGYETPGRP